MKDYYADSIRPEGRLHFAGEQLEPLANPYQAFSDRRVAKGFICLSAGAPDKPASVVKIGLAGEPLEVLRRIRIVCKLPTVYGRLATATRNE